MKNIKKNATIKSKVKGKETPFNVDLNYSEQYDSFNIKVKKGEGIMSYTDSLQSLPLEVVQKLNEMLEEVLVKAGSETEMKEDLEVELGAEPNPSHSSRSHEGSVKIKTHRVKVKSLSEAQNEVRGFIEENDLGAGNFTGGDLFSHGKKIGRVSYNGRLWNLKDEPMKMSNGGDFQSGVYAKGGSLEAHGIEVGDTFVKTISGGIQKVKNKNGKIVYINLSNGERDSQPPLPFENGGKVSEDLFENYDKQTKKLAEIVENYMSKFDEGDYDYQDSKNFLKEVEAVGYTFDFGLDNEPYGLRPIGTKLKEYANGGGIGIEEDIDMTDDKKLRVKKPAMPEKKLTQQEWAEKHNASAYEYMGKDKMATGGALVGNQSRIDMNKNGKIDAEDFKLLRSSMNGAWRNERKHVNHNEDYEVRYAKKKPSRTGYKGKRKFGDGGGISNFERLSRVVAKNYEGKRVKPKYQKEYGKVYSKSEAKEVGNKVAGKVKFMQKAESGTEVKKGAKGGIMILAKQIRKEGESWKDAMKRASQQLK